MARILILLATLTAVGCGDDTTTMTSGDLAAAGADLSVPADMTVLDCAHVLACVAGCGQNLVCQAACRDAGSTAAKGSFDAFAGCVALSCSSADGGNGKCASATDTTTACQTCLQSVGTNAPMAGNACHTEYVMCATS